MANDHPIVIRPAAGRVVVRWKGREIANSTRALELKEHVYPAVIYVPREDANMALFQRSIRQTTCPYKGGANYFSLRDGADLDENVVWTYERPNPGVEAIAGHLAFYPDRVEIAREAA